MEAGGGQRGGQEITTSSRAADFQEFQEGAGGTSRLQHDEGCTRVPGGRDGWDAREQVGRMRGLVARVSFLSCQKG